VSEQKLESYIISANLRVPRSWELKQTRNTQLNGIKKPTS